MWDVYIRSEGGDIRYAQGGDQRTAEKYAEKYNRQYGLKSSETGAMYAKKAGS